MKNNAIDQLMKGSIDFHVHVDPDPFHDRPLDALDLSLQAKETGMRAAVIKCHHLGTAPIAYIVNKINPDFLLIGSLTLNSAVGGLNPEVVEVAAKAGTKVIWMPTYSSSVDTKRRMKEPSAFISPTKTASKEGISIIDEDGKLVPQIAPILEIIKDNNIVLSTGHLSIPEIYALVTEARRMQIKVNVTHPLTPIVGSTLTADQQKELVSKGAYIEHCFSACTPLLGNLNPAVLVEHIKAVGAEHCILATDLGQDFNPVPPGGFRVMLATMLKLGLSESELELMVKLNPAKLLHLD